MTEEDLRRKVARNLAYYRRQMGLTQTELSERINYSDKSVSKWERAEGIPDLYVLTQLADIFCVSVEDLLADTVRRRRIANPRQRIVITMLAVGLAWLVATVAFVALAIVFPTGKLNWLSFIVAIPVSAVILVVFACLWGNLLHRFLSVSLLEWGFTVTLHLSLSLSITPQNVALVYIACGALQVMTVLWFVLVRTRHQALRM
ncbi:MAG: helix-turn-helix transcriptional regulator [Clostridia bacterium]|nr:helix-turn-helix transcriptional regulator [Clostridia bacterium]